MPFSEEEKGVIGVVALMWGKGASGSGGGKKKNPPPPWSQRKGKSSFDVCAPSNLAHTRERERRKKGTSAAAPIHRSLPGRTKRCCEKTGPLEYSERGERKTRMRVSGARSYKSFVDDAGLLQSEKGRHREQTDARKIGKALLAPLARGGAREKKRNASRLPTRKKGHTWDVVASSRSPLNKGFW